MEGLRASLPVDPQDHNRVYVMTQSTVARSTDGGASCSPILGTGTAALPSTGDYLSIVAYPYTPQIRLRPHGSASS